MKAPQGKLFFLVFLLLFSISCTTEYNLATQKQETLLYGDDKEIKIGEAGAKSIEAHFKNKMVTDVDVNERVEKILRRIIAVSDRKELVYFIKVIDEDEVNAVSLPGGYVYIFKKLIDKVDNDDQLASVIAHEVGHINAKHAVKRLQAAYGALLLQVAAIEAGGGRAASGVNLALNSIFMEYSLKDEFEADRLGVKYMTKAGYDPKQMAKFLEKLKEIQEKEPPHEYSYWRTHPYILQRIGNVNKEITGQIDFKGYLNLTGD